MWAWAAEGSGLGGLEAPGARVYGLGGGSLRRGDFLVVQGTRKKLNVSQRGEQQPRYELVFFLVEGVLESFEFSLGHLVGLDLSNPQGPQCRVG